MKKTSKKTFKTKEAFLQDTINYYSKNHLLRSVKDGGCSYNPIGFNPKSQGCAIGRFLTEKNATKADNTEMGTVNDIFEYSPEILPKWMKTFGEKFLTDVQNLHDSNGYWSGKGLTDYGKEKIERIIINNNLNKNLLKY